MKSGERVIVGVTYISKVLDTLYVYKIFCKSLLQEKLMVFFLLQFFLIEKVGGLDSNVFAFFANGWWGWILIFCIFLRWLVGLDFHFVHLFPIFGGAGFSFCRRKLKVGWLSATQ